MELEFDVVELDEPDNPEEGETAPDFERPLVNDEYWEDTSLSALTDEGPVALIFYPMDGAFPATYIWNELRDRDIDSNEITVVGLSISTPYEHKTLLQERELEDTEIQLFSDPSNEVAEQYGIVNDLDGMTGIDEPRTATFVIDDERTIQYAWVASEHPDFPDYDEFEAAVEDAAGD
ncbi:MAG: redoxin domain-containing protein [Halovenus sp.]|uniref:redoxin domain-containing protein n=1 Tax=Halovenus amylolytica TaxID=2500550 RepID=UPI000FE442F5